MYGISKKKTFIKTVLNKLSVLTNCWTHHFISTDSKEDYRWVCLREMNKHLIYRLQSNWNFGVINWLLSIPIICFVHVNTIYNATWTQTVYCQTRHKCTQKITKPEVGKKLLWGSCLAVMPHPCLADTAALNKMTPCRLQHMHIKYWIKNRFWWTQAFVFTHRLFYKDNQKPTN